MKYLWVDVEWADVRSGNKKERELIEIGACSFNSLDERDCKTFFKIIKNKGHTLVSDKTLKFMHLSKMILEKGKSLEEVMSNFVKTFKEVDVLVVWRIDSYIALKMAMNSCGVNLKSSNVVVLQDILKIVDGEDIGFANALEIYGINYNKNDLHCAKHDARYLMELYTYTKDKVKINTKLVKNKSTNTIHSENCCYIKNNNSLVSAEPSEIFENDKLCRCCIKKKKLDGNIFRRRLDEFSEESISKYCEQFGFNYSISIHNIFLSTKYARWIIEHNGEEVVRVYHENYRFKASEFNNRKKISQNFHIQNIKVKSLYETMRYIYFHDSRVVPKKLSRMEVLFNKIGC